MSGQALLRSQEELNGFRLQEILGRDIDSHLIFKAVNYKKERRVVKIIEIKEGHLQKAINEAIFYCQVDHPFITKAFDFMIRNRNRQLAIFMEYCDISLADNNRLKNLSDEEVNVYSKVIVEALQHLHDRLHIAHCDVRLESVQMTQTQGGLLPKLSFYNITTGDSVPPECYAPCDASKNHQKEGDVWSVGLLLLQLYSKRRVTQLLPELKDRWKPCYKAQGFEKLPLFQFIKNKRIVVLLKDILKRSANSRLSMRQVYDRLCSAINAPQIFRDNEFDQRAYNQDDGEYRHEQGTLVTNFQRHKINSHLNNNPIAKISSRMKYQKRVSQRQMSSSVNSDIFRLTNIQDRSKVKILNLSNMKIVKIQQIFGTPLLEWLYLENNMIQVIENLEYPSLQGLNLGSNRIKKIQGLDYLHNLTELYLQNNEIEQIENLQNNPKVKMLYLNDNRISRVQGLGHLSNLNTIALRNNTINQFQELNAKALNNLKLMKIQIYI